MQSAQYGQLTAESTGGCRLLVVGLVGGGTGTGAAVAAVAGPGMIRIVIKRGRPELPAVQPSRGVVPAMVVGPATVGAGRAVPISRAASAAAGATAGGGGRDTCRGLP